MSKKTEKTSFPYHRNLTKKLKDVLVKIFPENTLIYEKTYLWGMRMSSIKRLKKRKKLIFDFHLSNHCNLNCRGCEHFSSIAPAKFPDISSFENDCKRIGELFGNGIEYICFNGGEPLLNPNVNKFLDLARIYFHYSVPIYLLTNGILLSNQNREFWETCKRNNIELTITKYPIKLDFHKIQKMANDYGVSLGFFGSSGNRTKTMRKKSIDLNGKQNINRNFKSCYMSNECIQLYNGKLYTCAVVPYIDFFNEKFGKNLKVSSKDYIDIYKAANKDEILEFLCKPIPFCRYCDIKSTKHGLEWGTTAKEIGEWV